MTVNCKLGYLLITYIMEKTIMIEQKNNVETCCKETCCADGCCSDGCNNGDCSNSCCADGCCSDIDNCCN